MRSAVRTRGLRLAPSANVDKECVLFGKGICVAELLERVPGALIKLVESLTEEVGRCERGQVQVAEDGVRSPCAGDRHGG